MTAHVDNIPCICGNPECQIPYGLCHCGCGEKSPISEYTQRKYFLIKGQPSRYIRGHGTKLNIAAMEGTCVCGEERCSIPFGICHCGCGEKTSLAIFSTRTLNIFKGMPREYVQFHHGRRHFRLTSRSTSLQPCDSNLYRPLNFELTEMEIVRFWKKVDKTSGHGPNGDCWVWTASKIRGTDYGIFGIGCPDYINFLAHRISWFIANGSLPEDKMVLHHCDNRKCVRPEHLFIGTTLDNMQDCRRKGRYGRNGLRGETSPKAKLTEAQVREIRIKYEAGGIGCDDLGKEYGVSGSNIGAIVGYRTWKHV